MPKEGRTVSAAETIAPSLIDAALAYAAEGLPVFPCNAANKRPHVAGGFKAATTDAEQIRRWWSQWPGAMIGMPTGTRSGVWVLDIDDPATFERACPVELPATRRGETGKGYHLHFRYQDGIRSTQRGANAPWPIPDLPGAEVRGEGGYVILPPSRHPSGRLYRWANDNPPATAPADLVQLVTLKAKPAEREKHVQHLAAPVSDSTGHRYALAALDSECESIRRAPDGGQESTLNAAALKMGHYVAGGCLDHQTARNRLLSAALAMPSYNPRDPWTAESLSAKIDRALRDGMAEPKTPPERMRFAATPRHDPETGEILDDSDSTPPRPASAFRFLAVGDLKYRPPEYLIDGLIETEGLGMLFGDPGCGKSFVGADIGLCVATGAPFHGRAVKQGSVFLIAGEGHNGLTRRFAAWSKHRGLPIADVPLFMSNRPAQFLDADSARQVSEAVRELAAQHGPPALIEIDTVARNYGPGDENSTSDMGAFIAAVDDLKAQFPGCVVLLVHHSGHADKQRARGAMALKGALDFEYRVENSNGLVRLVNTKMKDAEPPAPLAFNLQNVPLEEGASSAVLIETDAPPRQRQLHKSHVLARDTFIEAARDSADFGQVHLDAWQAAFLSRHTGDNDDSKKRAFRRARADLVEMGLLSVTDDIYRAECPTIIAGLQA